MVGLLECRPTDTLSLLYNHLTLKDLITVRMPARISVMNFLHECILHEISEQQLMNCALIYSFGKEEENKLRQQILYFSLCLNIQTWG
jgi:membrane associated rhomboid family serine protease